MRLRPKPPIQLIGLALLRAWEVIGALSTMAGIAVLLIPRAAEYLLTHAALLSTIAAAVAVVAGLQRTVQPSSVEFKIRGCALDVTVKVADLFAQRGHVVIPVNDFFDTVIGLPVSAASVHGQFLEKHYPNNEGAARAAIDSALATRAPVEKVNRRQGAATRFEVGETIVLPRTENENFLLFALTRTDPETHKTEATPSEFLGALDHLWEHVRNCCNHEAVSIPVMGARTARVGLPKLTLVELLLSSASRAEKKQPIASSLTIVLRQEDLADIDLYDLKRRFG